MIYVDPIQSTIGNIGRYQCYIGLIVYLPLMMKGVMDSAQPVFMSIPYSCAGSTEDNTCPCSKPIFHNTTITSSPEMEWNLVCERLEVYNVVTEVLSHATSFGIIIVGVCADRFGRRLVLIVTIIMLIFTSFGTALVNSLGGYMFFRFLLDILLLAIPLVALSLQLEISGHDQRYMFTVFYTLSMVCGQFLLPMFGITPTDFRKLQLILAMPSPLAITFFIYLLESPRWLILRNRPTEAVVVLQRIAAINKRTRVGIIVKVENYRNKLDAYRINDISLKNMYTVAKSWYVMKIFLLSLLGFACIQILLIISYENFAQDMQKKYGTELLSERITLFRLFSFVMSMVLSVPFTTCSMRNNIVFYFFLSSFLVSVSIVSQDKVPSIFTATKYLSICSIYILSFFLSFYFINLTPTMVRTSILGLSNFCIGILVTAYNRLISTNEVASELMGYTGIGLSLATGYVYSTIPEARERPLISTLDEEKSYQISLEP